MITSTVPVTVTAVVTNTGAVTADDAVITITLPSNLALVTTGSNTSMSKVRAIIRRDPMRETRLPDRLAHFASDSVQMMLAELKQSDQAWSHLGGTNPLGIGWRHLRLVGERDFLKSLGLVGIVPFGQRQVQGEKLAGNDGHNRR